jgi:hypothetical protein
MTSNNLDRRHFEPIMLAAFISALGLLTLVTRVARADDAQEATQAAKRFNSELDANHINQIYDNFAGKFARSKMPNKDAFVSQLSVLRSTLGGAALSRTTVLEQSAPDPGTHQLLYSIRYKAAFPAATVYQDLTLIKENPGGWKLYGIYFNPVPTQ